MSDKQADKKQPEEAPERRSGVQLREDLPEGEFGEPHQMMGRARPVKKTEADRVKSSAVKSER